MKKFAAFFIAFVLLFQSIAVFAAESSGAGGGSDIEISFRLGDSVLEINGSRVTVETPFAENGTTLVPARVITEAFGSDVFWNADTRQVTINYRDVTISLKIDDKTAYVNGQAQQLLLAPRIVNGSTMVPLRFITETFGADVKWVESTGSILVTLSGAGTGPIDDISSVLRQSSKAKVGDSYYGWSMDTPQNMTVDYQSFDGTFIAFVSDEDDALIYVTVTNNSDNLNLASLKVKEVQYAQSIGTLVGQETQTTKSGASYVSTQIKDKYSFYESNAYIKGSNIICVEAIMDVSLSAAERQKYLDVAESFDFAFDKDNTQDLSDITDGMRLFDNKLLNVQFRIPAAWYDYSDDNKDNEFLFAENNGSGYVSFRVYSISTTYKTAMEWAQADYTLNKQTLNPSLVTFTSVVPVTVAGQPGYCYTSSSKENGVEYVFQDTFFYYEGYAYNIAIKIKKSDSGTMDKILKSLKVTKIDASKVGKLSMPPRDTDDVLTAYECKSEKFKISVPSGWYNNGDNSSFADPDTAMMLSIASIADISGNPSANDLVEYMEEYMPGEYKIVSTKSSGVVKNEIFQLVASTKIDDITVYIQINMFKRGDRTFMAMAIMPELAYSEKMQDKIYKALNSIEVIK